MKKQYIALIFCIFFSFFFSFSLISSYAQGNDIVIGESFATKEINIESQTYIDNYFEWSFTEVNSTHWIANFTVNQTLWSDVKYCKSLANPVQKLQCWQNLKNTYFADYGLTNLTRDLLNFTNGIYPLKKLTDKIEFSDFKFDLINGKASFFIIFPEGFKTDERAEFGFSSTVISTTTTDPFYPNQRNICKDDLGILHVAWKYDTTTIAYANSSDGANWNVNTTIVNATGGKEIPHISCDGNNITVAYEDSTNDGIIVYKSENNGASFTQLTSPATSYVFQYVLVERRGQRIYIAYIGYLDSVKFVNSTDGGTTWGDIKTIMTPVSGYKMRNPSMAVDGNGGANDKIYVVASHSWNSHIYFVNSTNSGVNWGSQIDITTVGGVTFLYPSITFSSSNLYVAVYVSAYDIYFTNSTNSGITWTTAYRIDLVGAKRAYYSSVTIDNSNYPRVFWEQNVINANYDIVYRSHNGTAWNDTATYLTNNNLGNKFVNTPYKYYNDGKIHYIWRKGTASPYNIMYGFVSVPDTASPTYSLNSTNSTIAGTSVSHNLKWTDNVGLSGYIFSFNNCTGSLVNDTFASFSGTTNWSNVTKTINSTVGCIIQWRVYANDTSNNWNASDIFSYITTSAGVEYMRELVQDLTLTSALTDTESYIKSLTQSLTITTVSPRSLAMTKTNSLSVTIPSALTKILTLTKNLVQDSTLTSNIFYAFGKFKELTQLLTVDILSFRIISISRLPAQSLNVDILLQRIISVSRLPSQSLNVEMLLQKIMSASRLSAQSLNVEMLLQGITPPSRTLTQSLNVDILLQKIISVSKLPSQSLNVEMLSQKITSLSKLPIQALNVNILSFRITSLSKTLIQSLNVGILLQKIISLSRLSAQSLNVEILLQKIISVSRLPSQSFNVEILTQKITSLSRTFTQSLSLTELTSMLHLPAGIAYERFASLYISLSSALTRVLTLPKALTQPLTLSALLTRVLTYSKTLTQSITTNTMATRIVALARDFTQSFNVNSMATSTMGELYERFASLYITLSTLISRAIIEYVPEITRGGARGRVIVVLPEIEQVIPEEYIRILTPLINIQHFISNNITAIVIIILITLAILIIEKDNINEYIKVKIREYIKDHKQNKP